MSRLKELKEKVDKKKRQEQIQKLRDKRWNKVKDTVAMMNLLREAKQILGIIN